MLYPVTSVLVLLDMAAGLVPRYTATRPNYQKPTGGLPLLPGAEHFTAFTATEMVGTYNHQAMIEWHGGSLHIDWKASAYNEDQDGQRVLYSSSSDGRAWSEAVDVFPSMPASQFGCDPVAGTPLPPQPGTAVHCWDKIHQETSPFVVLNGRLYAVSSVRRHGSPASFYPTPVEDLNTTLLRRVLFPAKRVPGGCGGDPVPDPACPTSNMRWTRPVFGPIYWASDMVPFGYANVSAALGIRTSGLATLAPDEAADFALFRDLRRAKAYTMDGCRNGPCSNLTGEQAVFAVTGTPEDVILYRGAGGVVPHGWPGDQTCANASLCVLTASSRNTSDPESAWTSPTPTTIPDLGSNLNAGTLSDGRVWLAWNGVPRPHVNDSLCGDRAIPLRNPLTLALSSDGGADFDTAFALYNSTVPKRFCGSAKPYGPSYPQARQVAGEGIALDGLWTVYSVNKEDIGVTFAPNSSLGLK